MTESTLKSLSVNYDYKYSSLGTLRTFRYSVEEVIISINYIIKYIQE
jgi:hypothetical protein